MVLGRVQEQKQAVPAGNRTEREVPSKARTIKGLGTSKRGYNEWQMEHEKEAVKNVNTELEAARYV